MTSFSPVRWGVIGATARIAGSAVIPAIMQSEEATLVAVASRNLHNAQEIADSLPADIRAYGDYDSLLADSDVEAVYVPLPNNLHVGWAVEAMNNGKHVLCEKPLAMNAAEAIEMVDTAEENGVLLSEAFMYAYHPLQQEITQTIARGDIGTIQSVHATFSFVQNSAEDYRRDLSMGGGALLDIGCYCVHIARHAFGTEPTAVTATAVYDSQTGVDTKITAQIEFPGGVASIDCSFDAEFQASYEITGSGGTIQASKFFGEERALDATCTVSCTGQEPEIKHAPRSNMYEAEIEAMSRRIRGEDVFLLPAEDGLLNMRVLDAIAISARSGQKTAL